MGCVRYFIPVFLLLNTTVFGSEIEKLFKEHYKKSYQERQCGQNMQRFIKAIEKKFGTAKGYHLVTIENRGFSVFGMVNVEKARGHIRNVPTNVEVNWYHHAIVMDDEGRVYDFDYTIKPQVVSIEDYLENMFLDEPECKKSNFGEFCGGRDNKLNDYQFEAVPAESFFKKEKTKARKAKMDAVLKNYKMLMP